MLPIKVQRSRHGMGSRNMFLLVLRPLPHLPLNVGHVRRDRIILLLRRIERDRVHHDLALCPRDRQAFSGGIG